MGAGGVGGGRGGLHCWYSVLDRLNRTCLEFKACCRRGNGAPLLLKGQEVAKLLEEDWTNNTSDAVVA